MNVGLTIQKLNKSFAQTLFENVELTVSGVHKIGFIGDNGSGKSTLIKILAGLEPSDSGKIRWSKNAQIGYLEQEIVNELERASGGEKKIIKLTQVFYSGNNVVLLDEPDNHLDINQKAWFEELVQEFKGLAIIISHDRHFLENAVDQIWLLEEQKLQVYPYNYTKFKELYEDKMASRQHLWADQEKERKRLEDMVKRFKLRAAHNSDTAKAYHSKQKYYQRFVDQMVDKPLVHKGIDFSSTTNKQATRKTAIHLKAVAKAYPEKQVLKGVNLHVFCGDKIAINAPNGAGKTTLLNIITGRTKPDAGEVYLGVGMKIGVYAQEHLEALDENITLIEEIRKSLPLDYFEAKNYLRKFLFTEDLAKMQIKYLSGGQKSRLQLAKFLGQNPDMLVLDEPTNHLDLKTVLSLERFLTDYQGTLILVSHDRDLVQKVTTLNYSLNQGILETN